MENVKTSEYSLLQGRRAIDKQLFMEGNKMKCIECGYLFNGTCSTGVFKDLDVNVIADIGLGCEYGSMLIGNSVNVDLAAVNSRFLFTPENLLENLDKLGTWSAYGLASEALQHYFPDAYDEDGYCETSEEVRLLDKLGCQYWQDAIIKYHKEVGYVSQNGFNPDAVNEF